MTLALRVLAGLVAGFALGLLLAGSASPAAPAVVAVLGPVGTVFVDLIRMTALPLVVSMLVASVGTMAVPGRLGRTGARAALVAVVLLVAAATASAIVAGPILARVRIDHAAAVALGASPAASGQAPAGVSAVGRWLEDLVPANVFKAAADGAMLPVILFAVLFGLALARVDEARRAPVARVFAGVADAMQRLVGWILELAPIGVFALAVPLAARLGLSAAGAVVAYVALVVTLTVAAAGVLLYPLGVVAGPMPARAFLSYLAPSQAIAFAARSSLAALPAALEGAERAGLPPASARFVLPLGISIFHFGTAVAQTVGALFLARLYGVTLGPAELATLVVAVVLTTFAIPGIPGGSIIAMAPVLAAVHLPVEGIGILLAVDTIPDMFRTTANLTGAMTLAAVLREERSPSR